MNSNEDYLDNLLSSVIEQDSQNNHTYQPKSVFSAGVEDEDESGLPDHSDMDEINRLLERAVSNTSEDLRTEDDIRKMYDAEMSGDMGVSASGTDMADELANLHMSDEPENAKEIEELLQHEIAEDTQDADQGAEDVQAPSEESTDLSEGDAAEESVASEEESSQDELAALLGDHVEEEMPREEAEDDSEDIGEDEINALLGVNVEEGMPQEEAENVSGDIGEDELAALLGDNVEEEMPQEEAEDVSGDIGEDELAALLGDHVEEEMPDADALSEESGEPGSDMQEQSVGDGDDLQALLQGQDTADDLLGGSESDDMDALLRGLMSGDQAESGAAQAGDAGADDLLSLDNLQSEEETAAGSADLDDEINALLGIGDASQEADQPDFDMANIFAETQQPPMQGAAGQAAADMNGVNEEEKVKRKKEKKQKKQKDAAEDLSNLDESSGKKKRGKKPKKEKLPRPKSEEFESESDEEKKGGFFAKLGRVLFGDDEEELPEAEELNVSDENLEVIGAVDGEKPQGGKKKKPAKGKKAKKGGKQDPDEAEDDEESSGKGKKGKPAKKKKEKKEKKPKSEEKEPAWTTPRAKIFSVFAFCLTILAILVILANILPAQSDLKKARKAYYKQDYRTAFQNLNGKKLNNSDYILYLRCVMILNLQNRVDHYTVFMDMGKDKEKIALNELMMAVQYYQDNLALAEEYGALEEMNVVYQKVLYLLWQDYGLSEAEAIRINSLDDLEYNRSIYYLLTGKEFTLQEWHSFIENADTDQTE